MYSIHFPLELKSLLQGQVFHCCAQGSTFTPHPSWEDHVTSLTRFPGRTQVQIKWNEFRPCQLQNLFIRDWGKYWNQQDDLSTEAETCLNLIPREWKVFSADTMINLEELQSAIRHTKKNTSAGCCGWTQPD